MDSYLLAAGTAVWLGVLTSISPCPLATNIAAISFIGRRLDSPRMVFLSGLLYMLGRTLAYLGLAVIIVASIMSIPDLSYFLQHYMNRFLGPILIVVGIFLLGLIRISLPSRGISTRMQDRVGRYGVWGGAVLGIIFALSFCPVSAALFFGSLIPLSVKHQSSVLLPSLFGVGTALPVILFAFAIGFSTRLVSLAFNRLTIFEKWVRRITGVVFIVVGAYYTLIYIFEIPI